jgi:hypothetical protein
MHGPPRTLTVYNTDKLREEMSTLLDESAGMSQWQTLMNIYAGN